MKQEKEDCGSYVSCALCGAEIYRRSWDLKRKKVFFCCQEHARQHRRITTAKATNCVRCGGYLSPKDLVRIGQYRAARKKIGKGEPEHVCFGCMTKSKNKKANRQQPDIFTPHWFNCYVCGNTFWRTSSRATICGSKSCRNALAYERAKANPVKWLSVRMKNSIGKALRRQKAGVSWRSLVGYGPEELMAHIERTMTAGMTWNNYGKEWHIDHIIPVSRFNYEKPTDPDFIRCWSLKNLQAMWAADNIRKSDKIEKPFQPCLAIGCEA